MDYPKSVPGVGLVDGKFVDEDQVSGTPGSLIPAKWGNDMTDELLGVLAEAGIEPDEANPAQLREAVKVIVDKVAPVATQAEAETDDEAAANNVKRMTPLRVLQAIKKRLTNASETVVGMLRTGTQAEVNAGVLDGVAVTPKKLRSGFAISLEPNGYIAFPWWLSNFTIQWGFSGFIGGDNTNHTHAFPIAFPNACKFVHVGTLCPASHTSAGPNRSAQLLDGSLSSTGFTWRSDTMEGTSMNLIGMTYIAFGN